MNPRENVVTALDVRLPHALRAAFASETAARIYLNAGMRRRYDQWTGGYAVVASAKTTSATDTAVVEAPDATSDQSLQPEPVDANRPAVDVAGATDVVAAALDRTVKVETAIEPGLPSPPPWWMTSALRRWEQLANLGPLDERLRTAFSVRVLIDTPLFDEVVACRGNNPLQ
jgi:hypothetical protein